MKIAVCDDSREDRGSLLALLESCGHDFEIREYGSGAEFYADMGYVRECDIGISMSMNVNGSTQQTGSEWLRIPLSKEAGKLKGKRESGDAYSLSDRAAYYVRAYGNLYDEIVQGYKDGTVERYVEDGSSETGFRKMTLEEELADLDRAFGRMADGAGVKEMISGKFKRLSSKAGSRQTAFADTNKKPQGTDVPQKLVTLAQAWKDAYKVSGSKEGGMEKVLSMLDGMFGIKNEA